MTRHHLAVALTLLVVASCQHATSHRPQAVPAPTRSTWSPSCSPPASASWSDVATLPSGEVLAVTFADACHGVVAGDGAGAGDSGFIDYTPDGGHTLLPAATGTGLRAVPGVTTAGPRRLAAAAIGAAGPEVLTSTDAGHAWTAHKLPGDPSDLGAVSATTDRLVVVGDFYLATSADFGAHWTPARLQEPLKLKAVAASGQRIIAGGSDLRGRPVVIRSVDDGRTWRTPEVLSPQHGEVTAVVLAATTAFASGVTGTNAHGFIMQTSGTAWRPQPTPATVGIGGLAFAGVLAAFGTAADGAGLVLTRDRAGSSWASGQLPGQGVITAIAADDTTLWAGAGSHLWRRALR